MVAVGWVRKEAPEATTICSASDDDSIDPPQSLSITMKEKRINELLGKIKTKWCIR
jgi:hypothetical protein